MIKLLRTLAPFALTATAVAGCAVIPDAPNSASAPVPQGSAVAIGQAVQVGAVVVTPQEVVEDSRCPMNARCVWAGRLVVRTRIDGAGWRETADLTLGEDFGTHGIVIALTSGNPSPMAGAGNETAKEDYRFTYEAH
ncbi:hypothetical protein [Porphyrobacter sp. ULC335]|uniref:hypothetical protein n=1 Tax=Porphyrobacter sp. ULC335 TaxID=2854260 RepID=UPI00221E797F|nr:hypothetical protein [Porphyrobacter sp. ULC335]